MSVWRCEGVARVCGGGSARGVGGGAPGCGGRWRAEGRTQYWWHVSLSWSAFVAASAAMKSTAPSAVRGLEKFFEIMLAERFGGLVLAVKGEGCGEGLRHRVLQRLLLRRPRGEHGQGRAGEASASARRCGAICERLGARGVMGLGSGELGACAAAGAPRAGGGKAWARALPVEEQMHALALVAFAKAKRNAGRRPPPPAELR